MLSEQYKVLLASVRKLEDALASIDRDLAKDREDLQDFKVELANLSNEVKELRGAVNLNAERVRDKVADVVEPVVGVTQDLTKEIEKKKTLVLKEKSKSFIRRIIDEFKKEVGR